MRITSLKPEMWVATSLGMGQVTRVGGTYPPSVRVRVYGPIPRGEVALRPRDIERELTEQERTALLRANAAARGSGAV